MEDVWRIYVNTMVFKRLSIKRKGHHSCRYTGMCQWNVIPLTALRSLSIIKGGQLYGGAKSYMLASLTRVFSRRENLLFYKQYHPCLSFARQVNPK
jgi:hypothetical protein